jgi:glycosyltransferase involved in cell wall biosynthesis
VKQKSIDVILKAFSKFNQANGVRSRLVIVGMGPEKEKLVALCKQLAIDKEIVWAGFREDIPVVMSSFDIFVLSSQYEGFGLVLLEAMAAKTPIVSIDKKPMSEIVKDSVSGFLVPPHDHIEFAKKFEILTDKELRNNMGISGASIVKNRFSVNTMVNATYETYLSSMKNAS